MAGVRAPIRPCGRRMGDRSRPSAKEGANGKMDVIPGGASVLWVLARCFLDVWPSLSPCVDVGLTSGAATKHRGRAQPRMLPRPPYSRIHLQIHPKLPAPSCGYESQYGRVGEIKKKKSAAVGMDAGSRSWRFPIEGGCGDKHRRQSSLGLAQILGSIVVTPPAVGRTSADWSSARFAAAVFWAREGPGSAPCLIAPRIYPVA